jgi:hypothetical protein
MAAVVVVALVGIAALVITEHDPGDDARSNGISAGSDRGTERAAVIATLIMSAKLNDVDPQA